MMFYNKMGFFVETIGPWKGKMVFNLKLVYKLMEDGEIKKGINSITDIQLCKKMVILNKSFNVGRFVIDGFHDDIINVIDKLSKIDNFDTFKFNIQSNNLESNKFKKIKYLRNVFYTLKTKDFNLNFNSLKDGDYIYFEIKSFNDLMKIKKVSEEYINLNIIISNNTLSEIVLIDFIIKNKLVNVELQLKNYISYPEKLN